MLGLRFYACEGCDTVHDGVEEPAACAACGADRFEELTSRLRDCRYLAAATREG
ncbi:hypothetical protein [Halobaculum sp. EA56]|uniref:hypothetical protein n=1 Tax=Halobaculum sp. EA56 TaxID=3421648 RepID=UPI003EC09463